MVKHSVNNIRALINKDFTYPVYFHKNDPVGFRTKCKIIKYIGSGYNGIVYQIKYKGHIYVLKHQKIQNTDADLELLQCETEFYKWINTLRKDDTSFFMSNVKLEINYSTSNNVITKGSTTSKQTSNNAGKYNKKTRSMYGNRYPDINNYISYQDIRNKIINKKYVTNYLDIESVSEYKKGLTLHQVLKSDLRFKKPNKQQLMIIKNILIQILYIIYKIQSNKWYHNDLHTKNVICTPIKSSEKVNLQFNTKNAISLPFKLYKFHVSAIDYGEVMNVYHIGLPIMYKTKTIISIIFDIERLFILQILTFQSIQSTMPKNVIYRLNKFRKKHRDLYSKLIDMMRTSYINILNDRAKNVLGELYSKFKIKKFINECVYKCINKVLKRSKYLPKVAWPLYFMELVLVLKYESEYLSVLGLPQKIYRPISHSNIIKILTTTDETIQGNILRDIIREEYELI